MTQTTPNTAITPTTLSTDIALTTPSTDVTQTTVNTDIAPTTLSTDVTLTALATGATVGIAVGVTAWHHYTPCWSPGWSFAVPLYQQTSITTQTWASILPTAADRSTVRGSAGRSRVRSTCHQWSRVWSEGECGIWSCAEDWAER